MAENPSPAPRCETHNTSEQPCRGCEWDKFVEEHTRIAPDTGMLRIAQDLLREVIALTKEREQLRAENERLKSCKAAEKGSREYCDCGVCKSFVSLRDEILQLRAEKAELERQLFAMIENKWTVEPTASGAAHIMRGEWIVATGEDPIDAITAALAKHAADEPAKQ